MFLEITTTRFLPAASTYRLKEAPQEGHQTYFGPEGAKSELINCAYSKIGCENVI
jgi:hypothetical protein